VRADGRWRAMTQARRVVLILGSGPNAVDCIGWNRTAFSTLVAINNAWRVRPDWDVLIHPEDFPAHRSPPSIGPAQRVVGAADYVPAQNRLGGFVYAGGTMAFTAGYWALDALKPDVLAFLGCDMVYAPAGNTHFYGTGTADPLRADITLQNLEAKSARLMLMAARSGCACVNLSEAAESRLVFPRARPGQTPGPLPLRSGAERAAAREAELGYLAPSGRYWEDFDRFDPAELAALDALWLEALAEATG